MCFSNASRLAPIVTGSRLEHRPVYQLPALAEPLRLGGRGRLRSRMAGLCSPVGGLEAGGSQQAGSFTAAPPSASPGPRSSLSSRGLVGCLCLLLALGCSDEDNGKGGEESPPVEAPVLDCANPSEQVQFVDSTMRDQYLWSDQLPVVDTAAYATPEEMLEALRNENDRWSAVFSKPEVVAFYAGRSVGLGFRQVDTTGADGSYRPRISLVYEDSPAMAAGLERGMTLLEVNGMAVAEIAAQGLWGSIMGAEEPGVEVELRLQRVDGTDFQVTVAKAELLRTSVSVTTVIPVGDMRVGYVMFEQFIDPSKAALAEAFNLLQAEGATELVIDLRYNTGGWVEVAGYLASLIAGPDHVGETFLRLDHNALQSDLNSVVSFTEQPESIPFSRVAFLTSRDTASASEALINGLRPYIETHLVGLNTYGKPVGSNSFEFCEKILQPITFVLNNVNGEGSYYQGLAPNCEMADDFDHQLGDPEEARLAAAIAWMQGNSCPPDIVPNDSGALGLSGMAHPGPQERLVRGPGVDGYYGVF